MKIVALFVALSVYVVLASDCPNNNISECQGIQCGSNFHLECVQQICTCSTNTGCVYNSNCTNTADHTCDDNNRMWICIDSRCRCVRRPNVGK
ncbi:serine protease inhibitor Cvsi-2-like [Mya arenaria]|uniref:serine protease inhibitor Cvsi-2-like n=1 Tax=Mya arenaria TaxID=6604 RepID=UPI0022E0B286|nr:serine protease inhibitor Cvsi-2-like [Mya arenaria]